MKFRPCIDLHDGRVKQIVGSTLGDDKLVENYISEHDPEWFVNLFRKDELTGGHVIMLGAGNENAAFRALNAWPLGLQVGGGINLQNAEKYLKAGASHVIVTSYLFCDEMLDMARLEDISSEVGNKRLVIDLSCDKLGDSYFVKTDRWSTWTNFEINEDNLRLLSEYCDEILIHAVNVEGKKSGIDSELVRLLGEIAVQPVTYAGGVRDLNDLRKIKELGNDRIDVTIGSALDIYGGNLNYNEVVSFFEK